MRTFWRASFSATKKGRSPGQWGGKSAVSSWPGNGTLFLDEIGDMSLAMQAKLLRVLQERTLERVGGTRPVAVSCRLIAATNKDIAALRARGEFREDLYYRLATVTMRLPPLRERTRDIPELVRLFIEEANAAHGRAVRTVSDSVMRRLMAHAWPGNIRQLKNVVTNAVILSDVPEISAMDLGDGAVETGDIELEGDLHATVARHATELERRLIRAVLERNAGNISRSAAQLGISRKTLYEKIRRHSL